MTDRETQTPPERPPIVLLLATVPTLTTGKALLMSRSRRPDSNRGPLHYESNCGGAPGPVAATGKSADAGTSPAPPGADDPRADGAGRTDRPQSAPSERHPRWWWALCSQALQDPDDPDAFWTTPAPRLCQMVADAKLQYGEEVLTAEEWAEELRC